MSESGEPWAACLQNFTFSRTLVVLIIRKIRVYLTMTTGSDECGSAEGFSTEPTVLNLSKNCSWRIPIVMIILKVLATTHHAGECFHLMPFGSSRWKRFGKRGWRLEDSRIFLYGEKWEKSRNREQKNKKIVYYGAETTWARYEHISRWEICTCQLIKKFGCVFLTHLHFIEANNCRSS